jgi:hypothetical protein
MKTQKDTPLKLIKPIPELKVNEGSRIGPIDLNKYVKNASYFYATLEDGSSLPNDITCTEEGMFGGKAAKGTASPTLYHITFVANVHNHRPLYFKTTLMIYVQAKDKIQNGFLFDASRHPLVASAIDKIISKIKQECASKGISVDNPNIQELIRSVTKAIPTEEYTDQEIDQMSFKMVPKVAKEISTPTAATTQGETFTEIANKYLLGIAKHGGYPVTIFVILTGKLFVADVHPGHSTAPIDSANKAAEKTIKNPFDMPSPRSSTPTPY